MCITWVLLGLRLNGSSLSAGTKTLTIKLYLCVVFMVFFYYLFLFSATVYLLFGWTGMVIHGGAMRS